MFKCNSAGLTRYPRYLKLRSRQSEGEASCIDRLQHRILALHPLRTSFTAPRKILRIGEGICNPNPLYLKSKREAKREDFKTVICIYFKSGVLRLLSRGCLRNSIIISWCECRNRLCLFFNNECSHFVF